jgi:catechol 2,3-dioxygenase
MKTTFGLPDQTRLREVRLLTRNIAPMADFYTGAVGLKALSRAGLQTAFSAPGRTSPLIVINEDAAAAPRPRRAIGLYHMAIRFPTRLDLSQALHRLMARQYPIEGASDHLFSEAIYMADPDGNGVELYVDRPRPQWPVKNGLLSAASNSLDIQDLLEESGRGPLMPEAPAGTDIGHIHLHVAGLPGAERFYHDFFGLDITIREMPGALFFAAGGYHHHIGVNTWAGSAAPPPNSAGLLSYRFSVPMPEVVFCLGQRAPFAGYETQAVKTESGSELLRIRDPNGCWLEVCHLQE